MALSVTLEIVLIDKCGLVELGKFHKSKKSRQLAEKTAYIMGKMSLLAIHMIENDYAEYTEGKTQEKVKST